MGESALFFKNDEWGRVKYPRRYQGAEWIKSQRFSSKEMSNLGRDVADLLGDVWLGIYHMNYTSLSKVDWSNNHHIEMTIGEPLSTYDNDVLTRIVLLSHDRLIRVELNGIAPGYIKAIFHRRKFRAGDLWSRMPTMEQHTRNLRAVYGAAIDD